MIDNIYDTAMEVKIDTLFKCNESQDRIKLTIIMHDINKSAMDVKIDTKSR